MWTFEEMSKECYEPECGIYDDHSRILYEA